MCPLVQLDDNLFVLELFHGPTLAFKDVAMQLLGRLMDHALKDAAYAIVGATSGDTAALPWRRSEDSIRSTSSSSTAWLRVGRAAAPDDHRGSPERARRCPRGPLRLEREGDVQQRPFRDELQLAGVNSINWARVAAQAVLPRWRSARHREASFSVPTGNFGDILAGFVAKRMGLPSRAS